MTVWLRGIQRFFFAANIHGTSTMWGPCSIAKLVNIIPTTPIAMGYGVMVVVAIVNG